MLEFSRTINLDLSNYDEDGACKYVAGPPSLRGTLARPCCKSLSHLFSLSLQGQFCWTSLWSGIKTSRCPRTWRIAARESLLPQFCQPLAINCCSYQSACCFSCTVSLLQGRFWCLLLNGQLCLLSSIVLLEGCFCSLYLHYRLVNLPTSSLWLCVYCCLNFVYVYKKKKLHLEICHKNYFYNTFLQK